MHSTSRMGVSRAVFLGLLLGLWPPSTAGRAAAQDAGRVNLYRFILGVDVPASPAFVPLGVGPQVLRGSAPKPLEASAFAGAGAASYGVAVSAAPYFLAGGGQQTLADYRASTVTGRLLRVLTKTIVSVGAARAADDPDDLVVGLAVRSTFHDPHDPVLKSSLAEDVAAALREAGVPPLDPAEEDVTRHGVDLAPLFARARRAMRGRVAGGDPQVSGGWGMAGRLRDGAWDRDRLGTLHHAFWLSAQVTLGRRFDVLATAQLRDAFEDARYGLVGAALLRKTAVLDLVAEVAYDTDRRALYPGLALSGRVLPTVGLTAALTTHTAPELARAGPRPIAVRVTAQWFYASDH